MGPAKAPNSARSNFRGCKQAAIFASGSAQQTKIERGFAAQVAIFGVGDVLHAACQEMSCGFLVTVNFRFGKTDFFFVITFGHACVGEIDHACVQKKRSENNRKTDCKKSSSFQRTGCDVRGGRENAPSK